MADLIILVHFSFVITVILGGLLVYFKPRFAWIHIPMVLWAAMVNLMGWVCPLTPLENFFRKAAGTLEYESGFLEHYLSPLIYPELMNYELGVILGVLVIVWNVLVYSFVIYIVRKRSH